MKKRRREHDQSFGSELMAHHALRRTVRGGIIVQGLHFDSTKLQALAERISGPIAIKINYADISNILVHNSVRNRWFTVPSAGMPSRRTLLKKYFNKANADGRWMSRHLHDNGVTTRSQSIRTLRAIIAIDLRDK